MAFMKESGEGPKKPGSNIVPLSNKVNVRAEAKEIARILRQIIPSDKSGPRATSSDRTETPFVSERDTYDFARKIASRLNYRIPRIRALMNREGDHEPLLPVMNPAVGETDEETDEHIKIGLEMMRGIVQHGIPGVREPYSHDEMRNKLNVYQHRRLPFW